jgi:hypothetical protein
MTDKELEEALQRIYQGELEEARELDREAQQEEGTKRLPVLENAFLVETELRPPATVEDIDECELFIGRKFSPSYRHFLRLHDGWKGFYRAHGIGYLNGTYHYRFDKNARRNFAITVWAELQATAPSHAAVPNYTDALYFPENFYRFLDSKDPASKALKATREFMLSLQKDSIPLIALKHTLLGSEAHSRLFLDIDTLKADGEMEVFEDDPTGFGELRWSNFYEFILQRASLYQS